MNWNGISVKRIHKQNIEVLEFTARCFLLQGKSGIALDSFDTRRRVAQITKIPPLPLGDANNGGVDLNEKKKASWAGVKRPRFGSPTQTAPTQRGHKTQQGVQG